jgi:hypothetical protein
MLIRVDSRGSWEKNRLFFAIPCKNVPCARLPDRLTPFPAQFTRFPAQSAGFPD